ncbi:MAG: hypothetical protein NC310_00880 [Roseburia sp.]|nr:hypothetical protein [Anaeroplasma bactoclasticum]MCM1195607.1 hypothetical protein [Roseburia sp.]
MEFHNPNQGRYLLEIEVVKDLECRDILYELDGKKNWFPISNQGYYAIYLDSFSCCRINESKDFVIQLKPYDVKYEEVILGYKKILLEQKDFDITNLQKLYVDLPKEETEQTYHIFKRLVGLAKYSIIKEDEALKTQILIELKENVLKSYKGKENYTGNWWVYEIGIPRCINEIMILFFNQIPKQQIFSYMAIENFYLPNPLYEYYRRNYPNLDRYQTSYANLADTIYIALLRNLLIQNDRAIQELYMLLPKLIMITDKGNGFYKDGGFLYHESIPYTASYGEVLLSSIAKILEIYSLLKIDCTDYFLKLYDTIERSYMPFLYHNQALNCVRGRAASRRKGASYSYEIILNAFHRLSKLYCKQGFLDYIYNEKYFHTYQAKCFVFNSMNRYIKRNQEYLIAISSYSDRISNYESINLENKLGYYQSNFTYDLYYNVPPDPNEILRINPYFRNGSTNPLEAEPANQKMKALLSAGVDFGEILNTSFHQKNQVSGFFSKFILDHSMVCVGTNIKSTKEYVSTIYNFDDVYEVNKNSIISKFKLICNPIPIIEAFDEKRSFYDLNQNESDDPMYFKGTRIYYKNPTQYVYQLYPKNNCVCDEYSLLILNNAHILEYKQYVLINCFTNQSCQYKDLFISGKVCLILARSKEKMIVRLACQKAQSIQISIQGYKPLSTDLKIKENAYQIEDEFVHTITFGRQE